MKLDAGRNKDFKFVEALFRHGLANKEHIVKSIGEMQAEYAERAMANLAICLKRLNASIPTPSPQQERGGFHM